MTKPSQVAMRTIFQATQIQGMAGVLDLTETTVPPGVAGHDVAYADSTLPSD